jgi:hypothetical protein
VFPGIAHASVRRHGDHLRLFFMLSVDRVRGTKRADTAAGLAVGGRSAVPSLTRAGPRGTPPAGPPSSLDGRAGLAYNLIRIGRCLRGRCRQPAAIFAARPAP